MNKKKTKKLRKCIGDIKDPISRRVFRRLKKQYLTLPEASKNIFLEMSSDLFKEKDS
jgi:hypothetical protein